MFCAGKLLGREEEGNKGKEREEEKGKKEKEVVRSEWRYGVNGGRARVEKMGRSDKREERQQVEQSRSG